MSQQQAIRLIDAIHALESKVDVLKNEFNSRLDSAEHRLTNIEIAVIRLMSKEIPVHPAVPPFPGPTSLYPSVPLPPPAVDDIPGASQGHVQSHHQCSHALSYPRNVGSRQNASFLPYAIEMIALASKRKQAGYERKCACGAPTFSIDCFRQNHFRWCRIHQRPILKPHNKCRREYNDCDQVKWERVPDWEMLVQQSYAGGFLGNKGIEGLDEMLFPRALYPHKYNWHGGYTG